MCASLLLQSVYLSSLLLHAFSPLSSFLSSKFFFFFRLCLLILFFEIRYHFSLLFQLLRPTNQIDCIDDKLQKRITQCCICFRQKFKKKIHFFSEFYFAFLNLICLILFLANKNNFQSSFLLCILLNLNDFFFRIQIQEFWILTKTLLMEKMFLFFTANRFF